MSEDFETQVVALGRGMRHVRTPEGAEFYNLPIGAPITADVIAAKVVENAAKGIHPPHKGLSGGKNDDGLPHLPGGTIKGLTPSFNEHGVRVDGKFGTNAVTQDKLHPVGHVPHYPNVKGDSHVVGVPGASPSAEAAAAVPAEPKPLNLKVSQPTISGNQHFSVGEGKFSAPAGSRLIHPNNQPAMAYVVTPDGKVHAFNKDGEVTIPTPLDGILAQKFQGDLSNDPKYTEGTFEKTGGSFSLDTMKTGDVLTNQDGEPQFTKQEDGSWKHNDLGVEVDEADIQSLYDSGDLVPEKTPDNEVKAQAVEGAGATNFKDMSPEDAQKAFDAMPTGQVLTVGNGQELTKQDDGSFKHENGSTVGSKTLAMVKNQVGVGKAAESDKPQEHSPLDAHSQAPEDALDGNAAPAIGSPATHHWAKAAKPGAKFDHEGSSGSKTTWSKDKEGDGWSNNVGGKLPADKMHSILEKSGGANTSIKHHGNDVPDKSEAQKGVDKAVADGKLTTDVPKDDKKRAPKAAEQKAEAPKPEAKAEAPKAEPRGPKPIPKGESITPEHGYWPGDYQFGQTAHAEHIDAAKPGDQFLTGQKYDDEEGAPHEPTGVLTKHEDGSFKDHETGESFSPESVKSFLNDPDLSLHAHEDNSHFQKKAEAPKAEAPKVEEPKAAPSEDLHGKGTVGAELSDDEIAKQPAGTHVKIPDHAGGSIWRKTEDNQWEIAEGGTADAPLSNSGFMKALKDQGVHASLYTPATEDKHGEPKAAEKTIAETLHEAAAAYPHKDEPKVTHGLLSDAGVKKVGGQTGSNEGGLYDIPMSDGTTQRYYVKKAQDHSHGQQEQLANDLYRAAGIDVPEVDYNKSDGHIYSKIVDGKHDMSDQLASNPDWKKKVQEGYAVDAWLGNRDVFGLTNDNILTGKDGNPYRIDNGGSLDYRAQGEKKTDWGNEVSELAVFKTGKKAKTFGDMTPEQEKASAQRVVDLPDDQIRKAVSDAGEPDSLADKLIARKNDLASKYDLSPSSGSVSENNADEPPQWSDEHTGQAEPKNLPSSSSANFMDEPKAEEPKAVTDFGKQPDGTIVQHDGGLKYTKEDGQWQDEYGSWYSNSHMQSLTKIAPFTDVTPDVHPDNKPEYDLATAESNADERHAAKIAGLPSGSKMVWTDFNKIPDGTRMALSDPTGAYHFTKDGDDNFGDGSGNTYTADQLKSMLHESPYNKVWTLPKTTKAEAAGESTNPEGIPAEATLLKNHDISGVKVGDMVYQHSNGMVIPMEKVGENDWLDHDPGMGYHWQDSNLLPTEANGDLLDLYHLPGTSPEEGTAPDSLADPGTVPNADAPKYSVGDQVKGAEHLNNQQVGTVLTYTKKDGTASDYTKLDNGLWLTPYGNQMPAEQLNANFTVKHIPNAPSGNVAPDLKPGQKIESLAGLEHLPDGTLLKSAGHEDYHGLHIVKQGDKWMTVSKDGSAEEYPANELQDDVTHGRLYVVHPVGYQVPSKPGETLRNADDIDFMEPGTSLDLYSQAGNFVGTYKRGTNNLWVDEASGKFYTMGNAEMKNWVKQEGPAKIHEEHVGAQVDEQPEGDWGTGTDSGLPGDTYSLDAAPTPFGEPQVETGGEMTTEQYKDFLNSQLEQGVLSLKGYKEELGKWEAEHSDGLDVQIGGAGGKVVSKKDLMEAAHAMEAHSSFHIKYGLKNAPDNPITQDQALQDAIKEESAKAFPNLKPKPAFIAYLKQKAGVETGVEVVDDSNGPKIHLGNHENPTAKTVQGLDGGSFSPKEVQDAIDILEGFQGKNFKAELNKQNSPLGALNPNDLVGFDKDKTVTKQKLIDLLKTKMELHNKDNIKVAPGQVPGTWQELHNYPVGTTIHLHNANSGNDEFYTKESNDDKWGITYSDGQHKVGEITQTKFDMLEAQGHTIEVHSLPDDVPDYAKVPAAVQNAGTDPAQEWDAHAVKVAPVGTVLHNKAGNIAYTKQQGGTWQGYDTKSGKYVGALGGVTMVEQFEAGNFVHKPVPGPEFNKSGVAPGKYSTDGGKVYMIVKSDGSGVYVASNGSVSALTPAKVKANHEKGMNVYKGMPNDFPDVTPKEAKKASTGPKVKKGPVEMSAGTYYLGDPNGWKSAVYEVYGDGTVKIWPKGKNSWNHPAGDPVPLDKIKQNYWAGNLVDGLGNSVVPKGHSGGLKMWNQPTTVQQLAAKRDAVKAEGYVPEGGRFMSSANIGEFQKEGVPLDWYTLATKALNMTGHDGTSPYTLYHNDEGYDDAHAWAQQHFLDTADSLLTNADLTPAPEGGATHLFTWDASGSAHVPEALKGADLSPSYDNSTLIQQTKQVSNAFGGGKIMQPQALSKYQKQTWLNAYNDGNFAQMYKLETDALTSKGKVHPAGYLHPGYPGNENTNKVVWGPAVPGEVPGGVQVEGDWSSVSVQNWSKEELDNYLIKAQMQNPTHLDLAEKRQWVQMHKFGNKKGVDNLSVTAQSRANNGVMPKSEPPQWSDEVKPAKSWSHLFDNTEFPDAAAWQAAPYSEQKEFVADNKGNDDLMNGLAEAYSESSGSGVSAEDIKKWASGEPTNNISLYSIEAALKTYYTKKQEEYEEELKKPVYSKAKLLSGKGSHETWLVKDQFDREYIWKPESDDGRHYRVEMEVASNKLGNLFGFKTPVANMATIDGEYGSVQHLQPNVGDFLDEDREDGIIDMHNLTPKQLGQVAQEHVLDWMLDNDDTHAENLLFTPDGDVVGIDKGRGLFVYGNWDGASATTSAHTNNVNLVATKLYDDIRSGKMSEEQVAAAYRSALRAAKCIQNSPDAAAEAVIREGVQNRTRWTVPDYMTHFNHDIAPKNADELVAAFMDRKHSLVETIQGMWESIYADSPYSVPEAPPKALGEEHLSGWEEGDTIAKAEEHKVWGAAPIHASSSILGGSSLLWTDKDQAGNQQHKGQMRLGDIASKKILDYVMPLAPSGSGTANPNVIAGFPSSDLLAWKKSITAAGKDITKNSIDKNYDAAIQDALDVTAGKIADDQAHWSPDLQPNAAGSIEFPSGITVPEGGLLQYKQALDHYQSLVDKVTSAKTDGITTKKEDFSVFQPAALLNEGLVYTSPDGKVSYHQMADGNFLKTDGQTVTPENVPIEATEVGSAWTKAGGTGTVQSNGVKVTRQSAGQFQGTLKDHGDLETGGTWGKQGHPGEEYQIELPTGERIVFRNHGTTSTTTSQQGRLTFQLSGADRASSLARVKGQLESMGLNLDGADEDSAETVYWRQMFHRVIQSTGGGAKIDAARTKLKNMKAELKASTGHNVTDDDIIEAMGLHLSADAERTFWHDLGVETYGADKVGAFIAAGEHLPKYHHMNLEDPEANTGQPYFKRIDVDDKALKAKGVMIAIGNHGKDKRHLDYITAGGMASTEERQRILGYNKTGASSSSDQGTGGANSVFTRVARGSALKSGALYGAHVAYWSPSTMEETGTYSYSSDSFGRLSQQQSSNHYDPLKSLDYSGSSNETMVSNTLSIIDHLEIMVFESPVKRDEAIQKLKSLGIHSLRGLPVEERLVLRNKLDEAMAKVKEAWKKESQS